MAVKAEAQSQPSLVKVIAMLLEYADFAARVLGLTDLTPMGDHVQVEGVVYLWRKQSLQEPMGLLPRCFGPDEAQTLAYSMDVGVHREGRHPQREEEDDGRSLRPHPLKRDEPVPGLIHAHILQEVQV